MEFFSNIPGREEMGLGTVDSQQHELKLLHKAGTKDLRLCTLSLGSRSEDLAAAWLEQERCLFQIVLPS